MRGSLALSFGLFMPQTPDRGAETPPGETWSTSGWMKFSLNTPKVCSSLHALGRKAAFSFSFLKWMLNLAALQVKKKPSNALFFPVPFLTQERKHLKRRLCMMGRHNEPSPPDIRKFIHRIAPGDGLVQDVFLIPEHEKWCGKWCQKTGNMSHFQGKRSQKPMFL